MTRITPTRDMNRRLAEHGRIRIGIRTARAMKAIETFRFTSSDHEAVNALAMLYGGAVRPWEDGRVRGQLEVVTDADTIRIVLPPDPLGDSPIYELWSKGGCTRRCDGETCATPQSIPDGVEWMDSPCLCLAADRQDCQVTTRLNVILPEIRFGGVWRLDTHSWNAAQELPGMVDLILGLQTHGLTVARLAIRPRVTVVAGQTKKFNVPTLLVDESIEAIASGEARLRGQIGSAQEAPALTEGGGGGDVPSISDAETGGKSARNTPIHTHGTSPGDEMGVASSSTLDDEVVEAEIVEAEPAAVSVSRAYELQQIAMCCRDLGIPRDAMALAASHGRTDSTRELEDGERERLLTVARGLKRGEWRFAGVNTEGWAQLERA